MSYWELAAEQLQNEKPKIYEALQELLGNKLCYSEALPSEMVDIIQKQKNTMEERQWMLPFQVRGRDIKIRDQLDTILKVLQMFRDFGSALANLDSIHAGIPWAGINVVLQGALNDSEQYSAALSGLAQVSPIVARYTQTELMYMQEETALGKAFEQGLVDLYTEILKYQVAAACHRKSSTFQRFMRALSKVDDWKGMIEDVKEKDAICREMTQVFDSRDQRSLGFKLQSVAEKVDKIMNETLGKQNNENARIRRWICPHVAGRDHQTILVQGKMGTEYADSGQWLIENPKFVEWTSLEDNRLPSFWVCGSVGCGKSSLISRIIEWHLQRFLFDHSTQVAYFYCTRTKGEAQDPGTTPEAVMSSLVSQLSWSPDSSGIAKQVSDLYATWRDKRPDEARLSLEESSIMIGHLIKSCSQTRIIIDALDECSQPYSLLRSLQQVVENSAGRVKLFVSSPINVDVPDVLVDVARVNMQVQDTSSDLYAYVWKEVKGSKRRLLKGREPKLEDKIIETLNSRAQGM